MHWPPCTLSQWRSVLLLCAASNLDFLCEWERQKIRIEKNTMPLRRLMWSVNAQQLWTTVHCWTHEKQFIALKGCATSWKIDLFWKKVIQCLELSLKVLALFPREFSLNIIMNLIGDLKMITLIMLMLLQTWNLSKNLHRRNFSPKLLHHQFHLISTAWVIKT